MSDLSQDAKYLLNNPAYVSALESAKAQATNAALSCDVKDDEGRRRYLDAVRTIDKVHAHLVALMASENPEDVTVSDYYEDQAKSRWKAFLGK